MSTFEGKYLSSDHQSILDIERADIATGEISGTLSTSGLSFLMEGHFHFLDTNVIFSFLARPHYLGGRQIYFTWAGFSDKTYSALTVRGAEATVTANSHQVVESSVVEFTRSGS